MTSQPALASDLDANDLNFGGGPGALPPLVLKEAAQAILKLKELGVSVLGVSHRSQWFADVVAELETNLRDLLQIPRGYRIILMQGGGTQQFSTIPALFLKHERDHADYLHTGYWSGMALAEAQKQGAVNTAWSGKSEGFTRLPSPDAMHLQTDAKYLHYVSNETVEGLQFRDVVGLDSVPRICDMSSDLLSRPVDVSRFALIYAHAQKNLGPAGVTLVILKEELLDLCNPEMPAALNYSLFAEAHSIYNTPPVFAIYFVNLVCRWLKREYKNLSQVQVLNEEKARIIYDVIDASGGFFIGRVDSASRSRMNVCFRLQDSGLEPAFVDYLNQFKISGVTGHRSVGGLRISLYNAVTLQATRFLAEKMRSFVKQRGRALS